MQKNKGFFRRILASWWPYHLFSEQLSSKIYAIFSPPRSVKGMFQVVFGEALRDASSVNMAWGATGILSASEQASFCYETIDIHV